MRAQAFDKRSIPSVLQPESSLVEFGYEYCLDSVGLRLVYCVYYFDPCCCRCCSSGVIRKSQVVGLHKTSELVSKTF